MAFNTLHQEHHSILAILFIIVSLTLNATTVIHHPTIDKCPPAIPLSLAALKETTPPHQTSLLSASRSASTSTISTLGDSTQQPEQMTRLQSRGEEEKLRQMEELEAIKLIKEQRLANKKKYSKARKLQEEKAKRKKDKDDALKKAEEATAAAVKATQEKEDEMTDREPVRNLNQNLHDILNGVATNPEPPED
jgi:hypothetical protein